MTSFMLCPPERQVNSLTFCLNAASALSATLHLTLSLYNQKLKPRNLRPSTCATVLLASLILSFKRPYKRRNNAITRSPARRLRTYPFRIEARSPRVRNTYLHHTAAASTLPCLGHKSFAVPGPLALLGIALYAVLVHRLMIYAPRFLPTLGHPCAVAFHFVRRDQLTAGLTPAGMRPCRAHQECAHAGRT